MKMRAEGQTMTPEVAVIIPHFNDHARLALCLEALSRNDLEGVEVVLADNGSDPAPSGTSALPQLRIVHEPTRGAAAARNRGVAETSAPVLMFLDADCVPAPDWVETGRGLAQQNLIVGGRVDVFSETGGRITGAEAFEMVFAFHQKTYVEEKRFSVTANLVTTRALFERTGPFIVGLSEDLDWCHRALQTGARIMYADELVVAHPARADWPALRKKWRRLTEEAFALSVTGTKSRLVWLAKGAAMIPSALIHSRQVFLSPNLHDASARFGALGTLLRLRSLRAFWMLRQALTGKL